MTWNGTTPGAPSVCGPSWAALEPAIGNTLLPDGRKVADVPPDEFARIAYALHIPGLDSSMGYSTMAEAYEKHLKSISNAAGKDAVAAWLKAAP